MINVSIINLDITLQVAFPDGRNKSPVSSSPFNNITLSLPRSTAALRSVTLETLLHLYVSKELVGEEGNRLVKQLTFGRLPQCLCLHVQRTSFEYGTPTKRADQVTFEEELDMGAFLYSSQLVKGKAMLEEHFRGAGSARSATLPSPRKPAQTAAASSARLRQAIPYRLCAVIVHLGAINSGHYVTYRRGGVGNSDKWYLVSDSNVEEVGIMKVLCSNPYMLFYNKVSRVAEQ